MSLPPPLELSLLEPDQECQMLPVIEQLRDYSNFSRWLDQVQEALAEWDLQDYIDPFAPRPEPDDSGYEEWKQQADVIFSWLCLYTSPALREDPIFKRSPPQLPEEYIPTVKDIVSRVSLEVSNCLWWTTCQMEPFEFWTFERFLATFREYAGKAILVGVMTPYQAFFVLHQHLVNIDEFFDPPYSKYGETIYSVGLADECPKYMAEETFEMVCGLVEDLPRNADYTWKRMGKKRKLS